MVSARKSVTPVALLEASKKSYGWSAENEWSSQHNVRTKKCRTTTSARDLASRKYQEIVNVILMEKVVDKSLMWTTKCKLL